MSIFSDEALPPLVILIMALSTLAAAFAGLYAAGVAEPLMREVMERYFKAEAKAEAEVLKKAGAGAAEGFLKERLKKNPVVSNDDLNDISGGLGDEAAQEFGDGKGLAGGIGTAFD